MTDYYRVMLGKQSAYATQCQAEGFIGVDFGLHQDLTSALAEDGSQFNETFIPVIQAADPNRTKIGAGLACGMLWAIGRGIAVGDVVLSPDGSGNYLVGDVTGDYYYVDGQILPHRRPVTWRAQVIPRASMSDPLKASTGRTVTVARMTHHATEIEHLLGGPQVVLAPADPEINDAVAFALEKHLEDFLVANWAATALGSTHDIVSEDGELTGQQFPTDTGPIDILAVSKSGDELLVVELKRGRASDAVVGQIQRYMGYVHDELAEEHQKVRGVIIALEDDLRIRRALSVATGVGFYRYEVNFTLHPAIPAPSADGQTDGN